MVAAQSVAMWAKRLSTSALLVTGLHVAVACGGGRGLTVTEFCHLVDDEAWSCGGHEQCSPGCVCVGKLLGSCEPGCKSDAECPPGQYCPIRDCFLGCEEAAHCTAGCRDNSGCPNGSVCAYHECVDGCRGDSECPAEHACLGGRCMEGVRCVDDTDCVGVRFGSVCRRSDFAKDALPCTSADECFCLLGACNVVWSACGSGGADAAVTDARENMDAEAGLLPPPRDAVAEGALDSSFAGVDAAGP